jgi:hypothetical protein
MKCPRCGSENYDKDGNYILYTGIFERLLSPHYTVIQKSDVKSTEMRRLALKLYLKSWIQIYR